MYSHHQQLHLRMDHKIEQNFIFLFSLFLLAVVFPPLIFLSMIFISVCMFPVSASLIHSSPAKSAVFPKSLGGRAPPF